MMSRRGHFTPSRRRASVWIDATCTSMSGRASNPEAMTPGSIPNSPSARIVCWISSRRCTVNTDRCPRRAASLSMYAVSTVFPDTVGDTMTMERTPDRMRSLARSTISRWNWCSSTLQDLLIRPGAVPVWPGGRRFLLHEHVDRLDVPVLPVHPPRDPDLLVRVERGRKCLAVRVRKAGIPEVADLNPDLRPRGTVFFGPLCDLELLDQ